MRSFPSTNKNLAITLNNNTDTYPHVLARSSNNGIHAQISPPGRALFNQRQTRRRSSGLPTKSAQAACISGAVAMTSRLLSQDTTTQPTQLTQQTYASQAPESQLSQVFVRLRCLHHPKSLVVLMLVWLQ